MLGPDECYRAIAQVELQPLIDELERLQFIHVNQGGTTSERYACDVVLPDKLGPAFNAMLNGLNLGGRLARAMLRRLPARQSIPPHTDTWMPAEYNWRRFQLPIITHPDIIMRWPDDNAAIHLEAGTLYEVRFDRTHEVIHGADIDRVHLQIDQVDATI